MRSNLWKFFAARPRYVLGVTCGSLSGIAAYSLGGNVQTDSDLTLTSKLGGASRGFSIAPIKCEDGTTVLPWSAPTRESQLQRLQSQEFDVLVIGGGCVGAGVAWEAATRGLKVALVERDDFAAGACHIFHVWIAFAR